MSELTLFGYAFDNVSLIVGASAVLIVIGIAYFTERKLQKKKSKNSPLGFQKIREKLLRAYEGNRTSATIINELFEMFNEVEAEGRR